MSVVVGTLSVNVASGEATLTFDESKKQLDSFAASASNSSSRVDASFKRVGESAGGLRTQLGLVDNVIRGRLPMAFADLIRTFSQSAIVMTALPVAAVVAGISAIALIADKAASAFSEYTLSLAKDSTAMAEGIQSQKDKMLDLDEEYAGITKGSMAKYQQSLADMESKAPILNSVLDKITKSLEDQDGTWTRATGAIKTWLEEVGAAQDQSGAVKNFNPVELDKDATDLYLEQIKQQELSAKGLAGAVTSLTEKQAYYNSVVKDNPTGNNLAQQQAVTLALNDAQARLAAQKMAEKNASAQLAEQQRDFASKNIQALKQQADLTAEIIDKQGQLANLPAAPAFETDALALQRAKATRDAAIDAAQSQYDLNRGKVGSHQEMLNAMVDAELQYQSQVLTLEVKGAQDYVNITSESSKAALSARQAVDDSFVKGYVQSQKDAASAVIQSYQSVSSTITTANEKMRSDFEAQNSSLSGLGLDVAKVQEDQALLAQLKNEMGELAAQKKALETQQGMATDVETYNQLSSTIAKLAQQMAELSKQQAAAESETAKLGTSWSAYFARMKGETTDLATTVRVSLQQGVTQFEMSFNGAMAKCIVEGKNFGQAVRQAAASMLESMIEAGAKMVESAVANFLEIKIQAAAAAAASAMAGVPFPADLVAGAQAFSVAMGFAEGGIVPGVGNTDSVPAMLTPGEGVLPKPMMDKLSSATSSDGGSGLHVHYSPTNHIKAWDGSDVKDVLDQHKDEFIKQAKKEIRRRHR